jgi:hypothetical protein
MIDFEFNKFIDKNTLTPYELEVVNEAGYWENRSREAREIKKEKFIEQQKREQKCYIQRFDVELRDYIDVALIFPNIYVVNEFFEYLFVKALNDEVNGGWPFYYKEYFEINRKTGEKMVTSGTYNFDYPYILAAIIDWAVDELGADRASFEYFMANFSPSDKPYYTRVNHFLITYLFGIKYNYLVPSTIEYYNKPIYTAQKKDYSLGYFTPAVVRAEDGELYYFRSVPFQSSKVLFALDKPTLDILLTDRHRESIEQVAFGKKTNDHKGLKSFFKINFPVRKRDR